jgi:RNAse (barnase) inhibitor barstar
MSIKTFIINGNHFNDLSGFYDEVQKKLTRNFRAFGRNLDAFEEVIRGGFGKYEEGEPVKIIWKNSNKSRKDLEFEAMVKRLEENLKICHPTNLEKVKRELEQAKNKEGQTLFDLLVEIIRYNNIELVLD